MRPVVVFLVSLSSLAACAQLGALFGQKPANDPQAQQAQATKSQEAERKRRAEEEQRAAAEAAEREKQEQALLADLERLRGELKAGPADKPQQAIEFAGKVKEASGSRLAEGGKVDPQVLGREAAGYLDAAMQKEASLALLAALGDLPRGAEVDAVFVRACPKLRPKLPNDVVVSFVGDCLERAGGDASRLKWPNVQRDLTAYKKFKDEELRRAREEEARRAKEEAELAAQQARGEGFVAASVFAAGRCNFGNCAKDGWTIDT